MAKTIQIGTVPKCPIFVGLLLLLLLSSCRTQTVVLPEVRQRDSLVTRVNIRVDSVYIDRWHSIQQRADTVYRTDSVYVEKYRYLAKHDTITVTHTDTITVAIPCPSGGKGADRRERGYIPRFYVRCTVGFFLLLLALLAYIILRIYLHR